MNPLLGQVVVSRAGRDKGRAFLVVGIVDDLYLLLADGDLRKLEKPKKKKIKHLVLTPTVVDEIQTKLVAKGRVSNAEIRKELIKVVRQEDENETSVG